MKPYSEACERNRDPILEVLREAFAAPGLVLEIGSGTGQHAVYFSQALPHLIWQPTDRAENLPGVQAWCEEAALENLKPPLELDVTESWPVRRCDYVFSANTAHIMGWDAVEQLFAGVGEVLTPGGGFCLYGPFNYHGRYTSESNARFDDWLRQRSPAMGIRDFEAVNQLAAAAGLALQQDVSMPANNRCLVWTRSEV